jgi:hypothetical protein
MTRVRILWHRACSFPGKRRDKDRIEQQQEERLTLLHKQASKQATNEPRPWRGFFLEYLARCHCNPAPRSLVKSGNDNTGTLMKHATLALACIAFVATTAPLPAADTRSISKVNSSVTAEAGQSYDSLSTVNGDVRIGRGASANVAETVNGSITIEDDAKVGTASTVNGSLELGEGVSIAKDASTVNGGVKLEKRARVGGNLSTVNGDIDLEGAEVKGRLTTVAGDIDLTEGARIEGGIHIEKPSGTNWFQKKDERISVHICATCVVNGDLRFDRPVTLRVESGAKIGKVVGDDVKRL